MMNLPFNWSNCILENLLISLESGSRPKGGVRGINEGTPSIGGEHLTYKGTFDFSSIKYVPKNFAANMKMGHINVNDILVVKDGATTGKTAFVDKDFPYLNAVVNEHVFICRPTSLIESKFLFRYLTSKEGESRILDNFQGSAQGGINRSFTTNILVPLPPLNEQRRIVAKLEVLLGKVDGCQKRLEKIPRILKRFRQSVLAAACDGRLTADWRERNKDVDLLESDFDIPQKWKKIDVCKVIESLKYGTAQKCDYERKGVPVLRIPNIGEQFVDHSDLKYTKLSEKEYEQLKLIPGDILLIRSNGSVSLVGKTAIVRETEQGFAYAGYLIRIRPNKNIVLPEYLNLALSTHNVRLQIEIPARSTSGVNNINSDEVKALNFNLPPLAEQQEIIRRVESLFKLADQLEARYQKAKSYVDKLTQSILAKAFRGELVAQDPNDEPASVLLERIKQEKDAATTEKTRKVSVKSKVANKKIVKESKEIVIENSISNKEKLIEVMEEKISSSIDKIAADVEKLGEQMTLPFMENEK